MTDFLGNELKIGDTVVFVTAYMHGLKTGQICGFTKKGVNIQVRNNEFTTIHQRPKTLVVKYKEHESN